MNEKRVPVNPVTTAAVARAWGVSRRHVQALTAEEIVPRLARNSYNLLAATLAYGAHLQQLLTGPSPGSGASVVHRARAALLDTRVEAKQLEVAQARSKWVPLAFHDEIVGILARETAAGFAPVAARLAPELVGQTERELIRTAIDTAHRQVMSLLASKSGPLQVAWTRALDAAIARGRPPAKRAAEQRGGARKCRRRGGPA